MARIPELNVVRLDPSESRRNQVIPPGVTPEVLDVALRRLGRLRVLARDWAHAILSSPHANKFVDADIALLVRGAHLYHEWLCGERAAQLLSSLSKIETELGCSQKARLQARFEPGTPAKAARTVTAADAAKAASRFA